MSMKTRDPNQEKKKWSLEDMEYEVKSKTLM